METKGKDTPMYLLRHKIWKTLGEVSDLPMLVKLPSAAFTVVYLTAKDFGEQLPASIYKSHPASVQLGKASNT